jgi:hypothetical protein
MHPRQRNQKFVPATHNCVQGESSSFSWRYGTTRRATIVPARSLSPGWQFQHHALADRKNLLSSVFVFDFDLTATCLDDLLHQLKQNASILEKFGSHFILLELTTKDQWTLRFMMKVTR